MTLTKVMKWLGAGAALVAIGAGLFGADSVTQSRFSEGATNALAAPPDAGTDEAHLPADPDGGTQWVPGDSNIYVAEAPPANTIQGENTTFAQVNISVNYIGTWSSDATSALERAVAIWESIIIGDGPIVVDASWDSGIGGLGQGGSPLMTFAGQPLGNTWYPVPLINQLLGLDYTPGAAEITLKMKPAANLPPGLAWHYGAGPAPIGTADFTSVALHEIGHGLGFSDSFSNSNPGPNVTFGQSGKPLLHDTFAVTNAGVQLITLASGSAALTTATTNGGAYFSGTNATAANNGVRPKLQATSPFASSNISHLDETTYKGPPNSLMSPTFQGNETVREPGPIMRGILKDYGYQIADPAATPGTIQYLQTANSTAESTGTLNVPVTRANGDSGAASAQCEVDTGGTAANPADYTIPTATVSWASGEAGTKNCVLSIVNDTTPEAAETLNLKLGSISGASAGTPATTSVSILANDQAGTLAFTTNSIPVEEDDSATSLSIARTLGNQGAIGVTCAVTGGSAIENTDFTLDDTNPSWTDGGSTNQACKITPINNGAASGNKTVVIALQSPTGSPAPSLGVFASISVTFVDDDNAGTIQFLKKDFGRVSEGDGGYEFVVERIGGSSGIVSAGCSVLPGLTTATNVADYNVVQSFVSWQDGQSGDRVCIVHIVNDDLGGEGDETVSLVLTPPFPGGAAAGPNLAATVTIEDDDPPLLVFTTQPGDGQTGVALVQQPVVEIHSGLGDTLSDFDANVTLSIVSASRSAFPAPEITCTPNPTASDGGVARFSGCVITGATGGMEIQLRATAPGIATALSEPFIVADSNYDATCDGETTGSDALALLRALAGFSTGLLPVAPCTGDANDSGDASLFDAFLIRLFVAGAP